MAYKHTKPTLATYLGRQEVVGECVGRAVSWQDLDELAERGIFVNPWDHLVYDVHKTFKGRVD